MHFINNWLKYQIMGFFVGFLIGIPAGIIFG